MHRRWFLGSLQLSLPETVLAKVSSIWMPSIGIPLEWSWKEIWNDDNSCYPDDERPSVLLFDLFRHLSDLALDAPFLSFEQKISKQLDRVHISCHVFLHAMQKMYAPTPTPWLNVLVFHLVPEEWKHAFQDLEPLFHTKQVVPTTFTEWEEHIYTRVSKGLFEGLENHNSSCLDSTKHSLVSWMQEKEQQSVPLWLKAETRCSSSVCWYYSPYWYKFCIEKETLSCIRGGWLCFARDQDNQTALIHLLQQSRRVTPVSWIQHPLSPRRCNVRQYLLSSSPSSSSLARCTRVSSCMHLAKLKLLEESSSSSPHEKSSSSRTYLPFRNRISCSTTLLVTNEYQWPRWVELFAKWLHPSSPVDALQSHRTHLDLSLEAWRIGWIEFPEEWELWTGGLTVQRQLDVVVTTYQMLECAPPSSCVHQLVWHRVVLDSALSYVPAVPLMGHIHWAIASDFFANVQMDRTLHILTHRIGYSADTSTTLFPSTRMSATGSEAQAVLCGSSSLFHTMWKCIDLHFIGQAHCSSCVVEDTEKTSFLDQDVSYTRLPFGHLTHDASSQIGVWLLASPYRLFSSVMSRLLRMICLAPDDPVWSLLFRPLCLWSIVGIPAHEWRWVLYTFRCWLSLFHTKESSSVRSKDLSSLFVLYTQHTALWETPEMDWYDALPEEAREEEEEEEEGTTCLACLCVRHDQWVRIGPCNHRCCWSCAFSSFCKFQTCPRCCGTIPFDVFRHDLPMLRLVSKRSRIENNVSRNSSPDSLQHHKWKALCSWLQRQDVRAVVWSTHPLVVQSLETQLQCMRIDCVRATHASDLQHRYLAIQVESSDTTCVLLAYPFSWWNPYLKDEWAYTLRACRQLLWVFLEPFPSYDIAQFVHRHASSVGAQILVFATRDTFEEHVVLHPSHSWKNFETSCVAPPSSGST